uniref:ATP synthase F0 subunit 8 n=1 Tax=Gibbosula crassa TaxID=2200853 RepID=A0A2S1ZV00_9BIVA|nr:ATP synthase F0 subunit 8 [Gibbosula crassa]AWK29320.1 ATP synthase F0 subunit 8 [Gibbosula crassa]
MPQLSPMSWVFVFGIFSVFFVWLAVVAWWGNSGGYGVCEGVVGPGFGGICGGLKWGFGMGDLEKLSKS